MDVSVIVGDLEVVASHWVQAGLAEDVRISIGPISAVFQYRETAETIPGQPVVRIEVEADVKSLSVFLVLMGRLPPDPLSFGSARPVRVGTVGGQAVLMSWRASKRTADAEVFELGFTIYGPVSDGVVE